MCPPTVAVINSSVRIRQEDRHREIEIEWVDTQVNFVDVDDADADVFSRDFSEILRRTDNLPVEQSTVDSRLAAKNDQQRFLACNRNGSRLIEIIQPWKLVGPGRAKGGGKKKKGSKNRAVNLHGVVVHQPCPLTGSGCSAFLGASKLAIADVRLIAADSPADHQTDKVG